MQSTSAPTMKGKAVRLTLGLLLTLAAHVRAERAASLPFFDRFAQGYLPGGSSDTKDDSDDSRPELAFTNIYATDRAFAGLR
mmetsp:Transcript_3841/g.11105  ORF Transcript_3841/g.11105 Transcript_3841/m.11105 type:complete len:82 (-) Transcript_3841:9-254(-)